MKFTRILIAVALVVGVTVAVYFLPVRQWFMHFESYVQSLGAIAPVVVVLAYILSTVLFIPGSALTIGSGTLFGLTTGFAVVFLGANLGALCSFLLARTLLRVKVAKWAAAKPRFRSLDRAIGN